MVQMPFQLEKMGANALGVYVCQFGFVAILQTGNLSHTLRYMETEYSSFLAGVLQLVFIFGCPIAVFIAFGQIATSYISAPLLWVNAFIWGQQSDDTDDMLARLDHVLGSQLAHEDDHTWSGATVNTFARSIVFPGTVHALSSSSVGGRRRVVRRKESRGSRTSKNKSRPSKSIRFSTIEEGENELETLTTHGASS